MFKRNLLASAMASAALLSSGLAFADDLPAVTIYATGGTIAGSSESSTDTTNYSSGDIGVQQLIDAVPELANVAELQGTQISNTGSSNIDQEILLRLSKDINDTFNNSETQGVVITHGTDTLEETGFFLDLTVDSDKPIVMVGAMRPASAISADGPFNLLEAVKLAANEEAVGRGTMMVLNDRIASAFYTTKTNAIMMDTFKAVEQGYLGAFVSSEPFFYTDPTTPTNKPHFDITDTDSLAQVDILYGYQDVDGSMIESSIANGAEGIVIASTGNGSIPDRMDDAVAEAMENGIPVVRASRTGNGIVSPKELGIGSGVYNPQKARILLSLAISQGDDMETIRSYFEGPFTN